MRYPDGSTVGLGDLVSISVPGGHARVRIVMLGDTYEHLNIDEQFVSWVKNARKLEPDQIVAEWIDDNPFRHDEPQYAPVGNYIFLSLDSCDRRVG